jgi:hypothetical protein
MRMSNVGVLLNWHSFFEAILFLLGMCFYDKSATLYGPPYYVYFELQKIMSNYDFRSVFTVLFSPLLEYQVTLPKDVLVRFIPRLPEDAY